jgi:carbon-monoxide dehydrogenase medium subunit
VNFDLHQPQSLQEALSLASLHGESARFLAGGTDLIIQMRRKRLAPPHIIDLSQLRDLDRITATAEHVVLGALVTHKAIERHPALQRELVMLTEAARVVGGHQVRNVATVGGNVVNASPAADVVAPLLALDAELSLVSCAGTRSVALKDFLLGPGHTDRRPDEMLTQIRFARPAPGTGTAFLKAGRRKAMEISIVCVAAMLTLDQVCRNVRITLGAVGPTTQRAVAAEAAIEGRLPEANVVRDAARLAAADCNPISDLRASAAYRRILVETLVERALLQCVTRSREAAS